MLKERAIYYYIEQDKNCAVSMLMAANDAYDLGLTQETAETFTFFGGGFGCGLVCGALSGAMGALSAKFKGYDREVNHEISTYMVEKFKEKLACGSVDCSVLAAKYKVPESRCLQTVLLAAEVLEEVMKEWEGRVA